MFFYFLFLLKSKNLKIKERLESLLASKRPVDTMVFFPHGNFIERLTITAGFISKVNYDYFIKSGGGGKVNVTFVSWDYNPWDAVYNGFGFIIFRTLIFLMFFWKCRV